MTHLVAMTCACAAHLSKELLELIAEEPPEHDGGEGSALGGDLGGITDSSKEDGNLLFYGELII